MTEVGTLTALFRVPPEQFTAARNRLVAELRRAGEASVAASVAKLPRPTPVVWAINQVAHREPATVARLVEATDRLKQAQLGHGSVDVAAAAKVYREAIEVFVERSLVQLTEAGRSTTAAMRSRLTQTLMASVTDAALRESLQAGRLSREQGSAGFDVFGQARPTLRALKPREASPPPASPASPASEDREEARRRAELELRLRTAQADLARAQERARELERRAADEARSAVEARARAAAAREAAAQGRADVKRAEAKVRGAEDAARAR